MGKGSLGKKGIRTTNIDAFRKAHFTVLQHSALVDPYMKDHMQIMCSKYLPEGKSMACITHHHRENFAAWLQEHLMCDDTIPTQRVLLARGPSNTISTWQGYEINGNTFYTRAQDNKSTNQNSGVRIDALDNNEQKNTYYGFI